MFHGRGEYLTRGRAGEAEDGQIIRFGRAAGEDDFIGSRVEQLSNPLARILQRLPSLAAE